MGILRFNDLRALAEQFQWHSSNADAGCEHRQLVDGLCLMCLEKDMGPTAVEKKCATSKPTITVTHGHQTRPGEGRFGLRGLEAFGFEPPVYSPRVKPES